MTDNAGYTVSEPTGGLMFVLCHGVIGDIGGGSAGLTPNGCIG